MLEKITCANNMIINVDQKGREASPIQLLPAPPALPNASPGLISTAVHTISQQSIFGGTINSRHPAHPGSLSALLPVCR